MPLLLGVVPAQGGAGNVVFLFGFGLNSPTSVTFGGVPATSVTPIIPGILLSAVVPAGVTPGTVPVVVNTASGPSNSFPFLYTVSPPTPPIALTIVPSTGPTAGGTPFTIFGANLTGATVDIGGNAATSIVVNPSGTQLTGVTPAGAAGNQPVVVTGPGGSATVPGGFTYTAPPAPPAPAAITPTTLAASGGTTFVITGTNLNGATVDIGGNAATVLFIDPSGTTVVGLAPPGALGPATVTVTTPGGNATVTGGVTYA
ncbi:IPT/TIG domain-containing protein [Streptomyces sp. NPDC051776]|uniref:IPT/TIG domain-containing protein n=1 Tax=Streptomyces sp. NPDC051776 TaxID=3155414 RepID=UPI00341B9E9C